MLLQDIDRHPEQASARMKLPGTGEMLLRPLRPDDAPMLGRYFLGLSSETVRVYGPHSFDQQTADRLCADLDSAHTLRMLGIVDSEAGAEIIAYFIVHFGSYESDARRYLERGMPLDTTGDCELAPSVADAYQSSGVGSLVMGHLLPLLQRLGRRRLALVGGVRSDNPRAIHFYEKFGFTRVGEFQSREVVSFDMIAEL